MSKKSDVPNRQVIRTRSWIFEAIMLLLDTKPYNKITVSDIVEKAGIVRQTFYHNYNDKDDVLCDYLQNTFNSELLKIESNVKNRKQDIIALTFNINYMTENRENLKKILSLSSIKNRIVSAIENYPISLIENYRDILSPEDYLICRYKISYQIIGSLKIFFDWFIDDMPFPKNMLVSMINAMNIPKEVQYRHIPGIEVRITE